jgi:hypothetical protein
MEARIGSMRTVHPGWGPRTILSKLRKEFDDVPSRSAIYRCLIRQNLIRQNLIQPKAGRCRRQDYKRWERACSMELWQMEVVGRIYLLTGPRSERSPASTTTPGSAPAKLVVRATAQPVCDALLEGFSRLRGSSPNRLRESHAAYSVAPLTERTLKGRTYGFSISK